jgi:hypothetical protein
MNNHPVYLAGSLELFLLDKLFDWFQRRFSFGRDYSCTGIGCGFILLELFHIFAQFDPNAHQLDSPVLI